MTTATVGLLAGLLVGSESTLVTVLRAKLKLVEVLTERSLVVLGYPSVDRANAVAELGAELRLQAELLNEQRTRRSLSPDVTAESYAAAGAYHLGSSDEVAESLGSDPALPWATDLLFQVGQVGPGHARTRRALERLALEVAPRLGWRPSCTRSRSE